ncbi:MAG: alpha/beta fold hydrolase [Caldilineaceae bacterium]|nr:alpha/beta fold hydrolase [Caldilineaceae bacterium]
MLPNVAWAQAAACAQSTVVQAGETLSIIAGRTLGNQQAYAQIVAATNAAAAIDATYARIDNPDVIAVGWKLCIPASASGTTTVQPASPSATPPPTTVPDAGGPATSSPSTTATTTSDDGPTIEEQWAKRAGPGDPHPLSIEYLREQEYPGSPITIEQTLTAGSSYNRYLVSYQSEGLKIYAYMTVPFGTKPATGWPVIIFNHGYIPPTVYRPTERYIAYQHAFAANGYIVLRPDYRGHADSEGEAGGAYSDPGYTIDVLNAISSIKAYADADPNRMGLWGHSMGGYITARAMVVRDDIKAGVIWAGVVGSYPDMLESWTRRNTVPSSIPQRSRRWRQVLVEQYGSPEENPEFWASISANSFLEDLSGPVQLHHGTADADVPVLFSELLYKEILAAGKVAEYYVYEGDDHNLATNLNTALQRSVAFFDQHVKNAPPAGPQG